MSTTSGTNTILIEQAKQLPFSMVDQISQAHSNPNALYHALQSTIDEAVAKFYRDNHVKEELQTFKHQLIVRRKGQEGGSKISEYLFNFMMTEGGLAMTNSQIIKEIQAQHSELKIAKNVFSRQLPPYERNRLLILLGQYLEQVPPSLKRWKTLGQLKATLLSLQALTEPHVSGHINIHIANSIYINGVAHKVFTKQAKGIGYDIIRLSTNIGRHDIRVDSLRALISISQPKA